MTVDGNRVQLPLEIDEIDADWLTAALSAYAPGIEVNDFEVLEVRNGFTTVLRVRVDVNDVGRDAGIGPTIMVKGGFEEHSRTRSRTYAIEAVSYRDVWPVLGLNVPQVYFADVDPERLQTMVIMEDLLLRGVTFCSPFEPHTFEEAKRYIVALAELHAKTWNSPDIGPGGRFESTHRYEFGVGNWQGVSNNGFAMLRDYMNEFGYFTEEVWGRFLKLPRCAAVSTHLLDREWAKMALDLCADLADAMPKCLAHGDMHLGNLYWDADGTPGFFDPCPRIEPAEHELAYYIVNALDPLDRRRHEDDLIRLYLAEIARHGVDAPSFEDTKRYMGIFMTFALIVFIINENFYQTEEFNTLHAMRYSVAMMDYNAKDVILEAAKSDPYLNRAAG